MFVQAGDEPRERGLGGNRVAEPAQAAQGAGCTELGQQVAVEPEAQQVLDQYGAPHGGGGVSLAACPAVMIELVQQRAVVDCVENTLYVLRVRRPAWYGAVHDAPRSLNRVRCVYASPGGVPSSLGGALF